MDKMIIVPINLFRLAQEIMIVDQEGSHAFAQVDIAELPEVIVAACKVHGTNNVRLIGNGNYAQALSNEIKEYAIQDYAECELNISILEA